jgi:hypothetical protein
MDFSTALCYVLSYFEPLVQWYVVDVDTISNFSGRVNLPLDLPYSP